MARAFLLQALEPSAVVPAMLLMASEEAPNRTSHVKLIMGRAAYDKRWPTVIP